jgi:hypothetical protein
MKKSSLSLIAMIVITLSALLSAQVKISIKSSDSNFSRISLISNQNIHIAATYPITVALLNAHEVNRLEHGASIASFPCTRHGIVGLTMHCSHPTSIVFVLDERNQAADFITAVGQAWTRSKGTAAERTDAPNIVTLRRKKAQ